MTLAAAEALARRFHEAYEELAPRYGYSTREASAVPWKDVPEPNRSLMIGVAQRLLDEERVGVARRLYFDDPTFVKGGPLPAADGPGPGTAPSE